MAVLLNRLCVWTLCGILLTEVWYHLCVWTLCGILLTEVWYRLCVWTLCGILLTGGWLQSCVHRAPCQLMASRPVSHVCPATTSHVRGLSPVTFALLAPGLPVAEPRVLKIVWVSISGSSVCVLVSRFLAPDFPLLVPAPSSPIETLLDSFKSNVKTFLFPRSAMFSVPRCCLPPHQVSVCCPFKLCVN